jgi:hypothetical protein
MNAELPTGPTVETIVEYITETYAGVDVVTIPGAWFFSLDPEKHWPNFATIVTTDEHDQASDLERAGVFRLNLGVDRETFERHAAGSAEADPTAFDHVFPHPVYAAQRWLSILNPSAATYESVVKPLIATAHERLASQRARHGLGKE